MIRLMRDDEGEGEVWWGPNGRHCKCATAGMGKEGQREGEGMVGVMGVRVIMRLRVMVEGQ